MDRGAAMITSNLADPRPRGSPPAVWAAFVTQNAWKSWTIVALLGIVGLQGITIARLATRPPEFVVVDGEGRTTPVRRSVATDALLKFLAERTRPPDVTIVRFTRDFLHLALALNSSTIDANWPAALAKMSPALRERVAAESSARRLVETYRLAQRKTEISFDELVVEDRTPTQLAIRATLTRRSLPLLEGTGPTTTDRVQVELVERIVPASMECPDGLEVQEWRLVPLMVSEALPTSSGNEPEAVRVER